MLKKSFLFLVIFLFSIISVHAEIMPYYTNNINPNSIGVYQAFNTIKIYKEPNENSKLLLDINWDEKVFNCQNISAGNLFIAFLPEKNLAFLTITDEDADGNWLQVSFNQGSKTGWIKKDDDFRFMNWRTFYNIYGRNYGLYSMKDAPESSKIIYGSTVENSKSIGKIILPQSLKLTKISGNWLLLNVFDMDKAQKIGWVKWREISGLIYLFPNLK